MARHQARAAARFAPRGHGNHNTTGTVSGKVVPRSGRDPRPVAGPEKPPRHQHGKQPPVHHEQSGQSAPQGLGGRQARLQERHEQAGRRVVGDEQWHRSNRQHAGAERQHPERPPSAGGSSQQARREKRGHHREEVALRQQTRDQHHPAPHHVTSREHRPVNQPQQPAHQRKRQRVICRPPEKGHQVRKPDDRHQQRQCRPRVEPTAEQTPQRRNRRRKESRGQDAKPEDLGVERLVADRPVHQAGKQVVERGVLRLVIVRHVGGRVIRRQPSQTLGVALALSEAGPSRVAAGVHVVGREAVRSERGDVGRQRRFARHGPPALAHDERHVGQVAVEIHALADRRGSHLREQGEKGGGNNRSNQPGRSGGSGWPGFVKVQGEPSVSHDCRISITKS